MGVSFVNSDFSATFPKVTALGYVRHPMPLVQNIGIIKRQEFSEPSKLAVWDKEPAQFGAQLKVPTRNTFFIIAGATTDDGGAVGFDIRTRDGQRHYFFDSGPQYATTPAQRDALSDIAAGVETFVDAAPKLGAGNAAVAGLAVGLFRSGLRSLLG